MNTSVCSRLRCYGVLGLRTRIRPGSIGLHRAETTGGSAIRHARDTDTAPRRQSHAWRADAKSAQSRAQSRRCVRGMQGRALPVPRRLSDGGSLSLWAVGAGQREMKQTHQDQQAEGHKLPCPPSRPRSPRHVTYPPPPPRVTPSSGPSGSPPQHRRQEATSYPDMPPVTPSVMFPVTLSQVTYRAAGALSNSPAGHVLRYVTLHSSVQIARAPPVCC